MYRSDVLEPLLRAPEDAVVAVDFDGTLSPIVEDPAAARPVQGVAEVLDALASRYGEVAVISGRPLAFLERWFPTPSQVSLFGLYGLETRRGGTRADHPSADVWRETISEVARSAALTGPEGVEVESKGLSLTLHYRRRPEVAAAVQSWAEDAAGPSGLQVRPAKMSVELHPPIDEDKGTVLARLAASHSGPVMFAGDDVGDLPGFDLLDRLASEGRPVLKVAVRSDEAPPELTGQADLLVDGPEGMSRLLVDLLA